MGNQTNGNQFREDEIVIMSHWDKRKDERVKSAYPKIGDRLRLARGAVPHQAPHKAKATTTGVVAVAF